MSKIKLNRTLLKDGLDKVMATVTNNTALPILKGIKITVDKSNCVLESTNLTASTLVNIEAKADGKQSFVVSNASIFYQFIKSLKIEDIEIEVTEKSINITGIGVSTSLPISPADDFPKIDSGKSGTGVEIKVKGSDLVRLVNLTSIVTLDDPSKPILKCVHLEYKPGDLVGVGVDGYRVGYMAVPTIEKEKNTDTKEEIEEGAEEVEKEKNPETEKETAIECNVPAKEFLSIIKNLPLDSDILLTIGTDYINILHSKESYIIKTMEGSYVNYKQILTSQKTFSTTIVTDINELIDAISLIDVMKNAKVNAVKFNIKDTLQLSVNSESGSIDKNVSITKEGGELLIAFNSNKFDILSAMSRNCDIEKIYMQFNNANSGVVIKPAKKDMKLIYFILPIRLSE